MLTVRPSEVRPDANAAIGTTSPIASNQPKVCRFMSVSLLSRRHLPASTAPTPIEGRFLATQRACQPDGRAGGLVSPMFLTLPRARTAELFQLGPECSSVPGNAAATPCKSPRPHSGLGPGRSSGTPCDG